MRIDTLTPIAIVAAAADTAGSSTSCAPAGKMPHVSLLAQGRQERSQAVALSQLTVDRPVCSEYSEYSV
jgi:hypothetical protein